MAHQHKYDAQGRQLCCTQEEKIYVKAGAKEMIRNDGCCSTKSKDHEGHSHDDGHDHSVSNDSVFKMFLPAFISLTLLLAGIAMDNWFPQTWFTDSVRIVWYAVAYIPVGIPVLKEAVESIIKGEIFSEFFLMGIATIGAFAIGEYPEGVAVMLFYAVGEVFQTMAVSRAKSNIKSLLDQRPDEVTVLKNNEPQLVKAQSVSIGEIVQLKPGEKLGLDGELLSDSASFNTAALTGESNPDTKNKGDAVLAGM
ncbi:MAG TPA: heavy metal translocating P-type ATPase, partial [Sphingobacterium sp.]|nr:heavy metal translocating P-type ATPase [Sphingobacterium sp.]